MRFRRLVAAAAAVAALAGAGSVLAITYGRPDGDAHPNVGALVAEKSPGDLRLVCSGSLLSPTVFVTAGHCTDFLAGQGITRVFVTFDPAFTPSSTLHPGTYVTNPDFRKVADDADIAVVLLASPIDSIAPARLPSAGLLDALQDQHALKDATFTVVGYGVPEPPPGTKKHDFPAPGDRRFATAGFNALTKQYLHVSQNPALGFGGSCYGDSGAPDFVGTTDMIAAIAITGDTYCRSSSDDYRLDTPAARAFLGQFVSLP